MMALLAPAAGRTQPLFPRGMERGRIRVTRYFSHCQACQTWKASPVRAQTLVPSPAEHPPHLRSPEEMRTLVWGFPDCKALPQWGTRSNFSLILPFPVSSSSLQYQEQR